MARHAKRLSTGTDHTLHLSAGVMGLAYPQRWEVELTIKEGKNVLCQGALTLRSKVPELVNQEFWGLLLAHNLVRK